MASKYPTFSQGIEDAIKYHKEHLGRNEYPAGSNRTAYGKAYGWDGVPYCAIACYATESVWSFSDSAFVKSASSSAIQRWGLSVGRNVSKPQRGDMIHLYKNGKSVHLERVLSYDPAKQRLICIGSNTSNAGGGSTADGGGTYINNRWSWWANRNRNSGFSIKGITRPYHGLTRENLKKLQTVLGVKADGVMGPTTKSAIVKAQKAAGLKADGFPGPNTLSTLLDGAKAVVNDTSGKMETAKKAPWESSKTIQSLSKDEVKKIQTALKEKGYDIGSYGVDGSYGKDTYDAVMKFQKDNKLTVDGVAGSDTQKKLFAKKEEAPKPKPKAAKAPDFPLPRKRDAMFYYGREGGPIESVSGKGRNSKVPGDVVKDSNGRWYSKGLKKWQAQMLKRGWKQLKVADGRFGDDTETVVGQFQKLVGIRVDKKIGPDTWDAAWEEPIQ